MTVWTCRACGDDVEISEETVGRFFLLPGPEAIEAVQAEQARHLAVCDPYLTQKAANGIALLELELQKAAPS